MNKRIENCGSRQSEVLRGATRISVTNHAPAPTEVCESGGGESSQSSSVVPVCSSHDLALLVHDTHPLLNVVLRTPPRPLFASVAPALSSSSSSRSAAPVRESCRFE